MNPKYILTGIGISTAVIVSSMGSYFQDVLPSIHFPLPHAAATAMTAFGFSCLFYSENSAKHRPKPIDGIRCSLHNHTEFSDYAAIYAKLPVVLREAFRQGIGVLAITDMNNDFLYRNLPKEMKEIKDFTLEHYSPRLAIIREECSGKILYLLHGIECHIPRGHILGIGIDEIEKVYSSPIDNAKQIKEKGGIIIAAHPFATPFGGCGKETLDELVKQELITAIEGHNGQCRFIPGIDARKWNEQAKKYAIENILPAIATPDSRHPKDVGTCYFIMPAEALDCSSEEQVIRSLKGAISESTFPKYYRMNVEGYCPLHLFIRTFISLSRLGRRWPWRRKAKGE